jgi:hypothetical protein
LLNGDLKEKALNRLKNANNEYQRTVKSVTDNAERLHNLRISSSQKIIKAAEVYVNTLANTPKEFEKEIGTLKLSFERFEKIMDQISSEDNVAEVGGTTTGAGVVVGAGVATLGPTAAVAIATTFGTASTGTAITALSGAAATNAALAWLGGGAIAAGGGGMAAGNTLLALAGPIGWAIGGGAILGGTLWARKKNREIAETANKESGKIKTSTKKLQVADREISEVHQLTQTHVGGAQKQLSTLNETAPKDYLKFPEPLKAELGSLINNIRSLSALLNKSIG